MSARMTKVQIFIATFCLSNFLALSCAEGIIERFRPVKDDSMQSKLLSHDDSVKVVHATKVKRFDRITLPIIASALHPLYYSYNSFPPLWQAAAKIVADGTAESNADGMVTFQQWPAHNYVKVTINVTGLPVGKHALHIHTFGDLTDGCQSTGPHFPNNFIGNIDTKEDGSISSAFLSAYLNLFGFRGIIGRSIVIHSKPIDLNTSLNAEVFSSSLQVLPEAIAFQSEEQSVGPPIACGIISIVSSAISMNGIMTMPPPPPPPQK